MKYWKFRSDNNWFSLKVPENWAEYDDEENTFAFFNKDKWSGNLRISHLRRKTEDRNEKSFMYNHEKFAENPCAIRVKLGKWDATFNSQESNEKDVIYFWITGSKNDLFICSFTFDKPFLSTDWHNNEIIVVTTILGSIKIIN